MLDLDKNQLKVFAIMAMIILILLAVLIYREFFDRGNAVVLIEESSQMGDMDQLEESHTMPAELQEPSEICVYITGAVERPGIVTLKEGSRLADAIELVGGALDDADLSKINLALKVEDEGMYIIPRIGETIEEPLVQGNPSTEKGSKNGKININRADAALLETLPGIGPSKAARIIEYREANGSFKNIEDIMNVSGIGPKTFDSIKDLICVD